MAEGGTLFLDEIDSLSIPAQSKLLRFFQDRSYRPLGAEQFCRGDVRILAATNRDLEKAVSQGTFRRDLLFRMNALHLHMVPLRERIDDVELLAHHFLDLCRAELGGTRKMLSAHAVRLLRSLDWPGNVRELSNVIRRAALFAEGTLILPCHMFAGRLEPPESPSLSFRDARAKVLTSFERQYVQDLLRKHHGNVTRAAREAGKERRVFGRLVKRHDIAPRELT
jgi:two-component system response regulator GlrR